MNDKALYLQLSYYTLSRGDTYFIHQLIVDTYCAQHFGPDVKPIAITFAVIGLYLVNEKKYTGKQVQNVHITLAGKNKAKNWPQLHPPNEKATLSVEDVLEAPDDQKDEMIKKWCQAVWKTWKPQEDVIANTLMQFLPLPD